VEQDVLGLKNHHIDVYRLADLVTVVSRDLRVTWLLIWKCHSSRLVATNAQLAVAAADRWLSLNDVPLQTCTCFTNPSDHTRLLPPALPSEMHFRIVSFRIASWAWPATEEKALGFIHRRKERLIIKNVKMGRSLFVSVQCCLLSKAELRALYRYVNNIGTLTTLRYGHSVFDNLLFVSKDKLSKILNAKSKKKVYFY